MRRINGISTVLLCVFVLTGCDLFKSKKGPKAPSRLSASAETVSSLVLSWRDNSGNEHGFVIEQRSPGSESFNQVGEVDRDVTQFTLTGVDPSARNYFRVFAYNSDGNSEYSNTVNFKIYGSGEGHVVADFTLKDQNNNDYSLHSNTGKVILLNFTAEW